MTDRYFARPASDRIGPHHFWYVVDRQRGDLNVTNRLLREMLPGWQGRAMFALPNQAGTIAAYANKTDHAPVEQAGDAS